MPFEQFFLTLRARSLVVLSVFTLTTAAALIGSLLITRQYQSTAQILVDINAPDQVSGAVNVDPNPLHIQEVMATLADVIGSDRVIFKVIADLKLLEDPQELARWKKEAGGKLSAKEYFAEFLREHLEIKPTRESSVVALSFTDRSPQFAASVVNSFVQAFLATQIELRSESAKSNVPWFDAHSQLLRETLEKAEERLSRYQQEKGIVVSDERLDAELTRLNDLSAQLTLVQGQRVDSSSRAHEAQGQADAAPDVVQSLTVQKLREDLAQAEAKLQDLSGRLGENHPQYQSAVAEVQTLRHRLAAEVEQVRRNVGATNQVNVQRESELRAEIATQKARLLAMRAQRDEASVLQKDVESAQRAYDSANQRLSQDRLASQIDHTNVTLLTEARPPEVHVKPKIRLNTMIGALLGAILGVASALVLEHFERRLRSPGEAARLLNLPILGSMPDDIPPKAGWRRAMKWT